MNIKTVAVIGANGTMGSNVSGIFASFGNAKVYMISRSMEKSLQAVQKAAKSVRANGIVQNLIPADYSMLEQCIRESDLVFESVAENLEIKKEIAAKIAACAKENVIVATGTSGLSITALAETFPDSLKSRYFGVHMFNPPYNLTLCELIATKYSDGELTEQLRVYLAETLRRTVVDVKDAPAFLGNRIGFQFINRALQFAEKYQDKGGVDYIDAILGPFSGRSMQPIVTADFVGLDVHKAIVDNVHLNAPDYAQNTFALPTYVQKLIDEGKLGRKTRGGLYKQEVLEDGKKRMLVYDIASNTYRERAKYDHPFAAEMKEALRVGDYRKAFTALVNDQSQEAKICLEFLLQYIVYSLYAAKNVGYTVHAADDVMATGFNWCPPLAMAQALSTVADLKELVHTRVAPEVFHNVDVDALLAAIEDSKYDYRPCFKSV